MTLPEILKAKGLSEDDVQSVIGEMKQNKIFTASEENLDIRYKDLQGKFEGKNKEHREAAALIEQLKKDNAGNEALQGKITEYESTVASLQKQLEQTKIDAALNVALLEAKASDVDYLAFKIKEKGELALDESGKIKGIVDLIASTKMQYPNHFTPEAQRQQIEPQPLPAQRQDGAGISKKELLRKSYAERAAFAAENPEAYNKLMKS